MGVDNLPVEHVACILARLAIELFKMAYGAEAPGLDVAINDASELLSNVAREPDHQDLAQTERSAAGGEAARRPRPSRSYRPRQSARRPRKQQRTKAERKPKERQR